MLLINNWVTVKELCLRMNFNNTKSDKYILITLPKDLIVNGEQDKVIKNLNYLYLSGLIFAENLIKLSSQQLLSSK